MAQVEFQYDGISTIIECNEEQKMHEICNNFITKSNINENNINYIYDGKGYKQFDKNITFAQIANTFDKARKKMNIFVMSNEKTYIDDNNTKARAKNIICPKCSENIKIKKIENYKIDLYECKNNHKYNISINELEKNTNDEFKEHCMQYM